MQYNGKEKTEDFSLMYNDHGARNLCLQTGRWTGVDELAHKYWETSPFVSMGNNPIKFVDLDGRSIADFFDENGNKIGTDGKKSDKSKYLVTDKKEVNQILKNDKKDKTTNLSEVKSKQKLVSDAVLHESVAILERTQNPAGNDAKGGLHGEASIVLKDGSVLVGESGSRAYIQDGILTADEKLPNLPSGMTNDDVEATIHSHVTEKIIEGNTIYSHDSQPSDTDTKTFKKYSTNVIVGPFETVKGTIKAEGGVSYSKPKVGISVHDANSTLMYRLSIQAVKKIIGTK
jgi:hypothetical protein